MIKICPNCGKHFAPNVSQRKYCFKCSTEQAKIRNWIKKQIWFAREWASWNRDFTLGRTISNV